MIYLVLKSESKNRINSCIGVLCVEKWKNQQSLQLATWNH